MQRNQCDKLDTLVQVRIQKRKVENAQKELWEERGKSEEAERVKDVAK